MDDDGAYPQPVYDWLLRQLQQLPEAQRGDTSNERLRERFPIAASCSNGDCQERDVPNSRIMFLVFRDATPPWIVMTSRHGLTSRGRCQSAVEVVTSPPGWGVQLIELDTRCTNIMWEMFGVNDANVINELHQDYQQV